jgi:hypothetical protein
MGTSKGYISPSRIQWSNAKRAVGEMIKDTSSEAVIKTASKFATAMKSDIENSNATASIVAAASGMLGFIHSAASSGVNYALKEIGREDLIGKPSSEIWDELLYMYTNEGKDDEDSLALDALSLATKNLNLDVEHFEEIQSDVFLKEMIVDYICLKFEFHYEEKIGKKKTPLEKKRILEMMKRYIRGNVYEGLSLENIQKINFHKLDGNKYVQESLKEAFTTLEELYMGE